MVPAIVYCEVQGDPDERGELATAKRLFTAAVPTVSRVQVGPYRSPWTAYGNDAGSPLLGSFPSMESVVQELREETRQSREETRQSQEETRQL
ncbi:hypothetical protein L873DRAFT_1812548, partial [Choiromyces venosus 120613-1]